MARIGLVGFFGWGNYGDELFLELWQDRLGRFHDVDVVHDLLDEPYFSRATASVAEEYDAFVIGGGDLVIPTKISPLYWNSAWLSKPVFIAGVGVPTWLNRENPDVVARMSRFFQHPNVRYISARDDESAEWIRRRLQPSIPVASHADLVFSMDMPPARRYERPTVGLVVRFQRGVDADLSRVEMACREIADQGFDIARVVLGNRGTGQRDLEVARAADVPGEILYTESNAEMSANLGGLHALMSTKFHGTVVATAYGVPTIVLSSTSKSRNLYRRIDRLELLSSPNDDHLAAKLATAGLRVPEIVRNALRVDAEQGVREVMDAVNEEVR